MSTFRIEYLNHQPGCYGPAYGDCWLPVMPNRKYTRVETALRIMRDHAAASTAPAFRDGVTRVVEIGDAGGIVRVVASLNHAPQECLA